MSDGQAKSRTNERSAPGRQEPRWRRLASSYPPYLVGEEAADEAIEEHDENLREGEAFGGPDELVLVRLLLPLQVVVAALSDDPVAQVVDVDADDSEGLDEPQPGERGLALQGEGGGLGNRKRRSK